MSVFHIINALNSHFVRGIAPQSPNGVRGKQNDSTTLNDLMGFFYDLV
jgi:hypothetical protein